MIRISNFLNRNRRSRRRTEQQNDQQLIMNESPSTQNNLINLISNNQSPSRTHNRNRRLSNLFKKTERNYLSAFCSIFCIAVLIVSLIETRWFYLNGGGCNLNYLGVSYFFSFGRLETRNEPSRISKYDISVSNYVLKNGYVLHNCTNTEILVVMRLIIAFIFFAIFTSFMGLIFDSFGFMKDGVKLIRRHAIFHILTVIICLIINGFCFWITERIYEQQYLTRFKKGKRIDVQFDVSYYLIVFASLLSILSTAFTLIRRYPVDDDEQINRLLSEFTGGYFDDPMDMQRSLPATTTTTTRIVNNEATETPLITIEQPSIVPPSPPPQHHHNINIISNPLILENISSLSITNEPPPPYLLDNDNDTAPLIF